MTEIFFFVAGCIYVRSLLLFFFYPFLQPKAVCQFKFQMAIPLDDNGFHGLLEKLLIMLRDKGEEATYAYLRKLLKKGTY